MLSASHGGPSRALCKHFSLSVSDERVNRCGTQACTMIIVTFSGLDGSGKSTHVQTVIRFLVARGLNVRHLVSHFISAAGVGSVIRDEYRRRRPNTNLAQAVRSTGHRPSGIPGDHTFADDRKRWAVYINRLITYPLDCVVLTVCLMLHKARGVEAVVCDRYLYDKLVNLPYPDGKFARFLTALVPRPHAPIFLDVSPLVCRSRREEHPADYYEAKYKAYKKLAQCFGLLSIVNDDARDTAKEIETLLRALIGQSDVIQDRSRVDLNGSE